MILYKYRGFDNFEFALDIFLNSRLYAANFKDLNDPMEGRFVYSKRLLEKAQLRRIRGSKAEYNICSLSKTPHNMLMWSYYADGHKGFVVGVEIKDPKAETKKVRYVKDLVITAGHGQNLAILILSKKLVFWEHEEEFRVFKRHENFVTVEIKELIFGLDTPREREDLLSKIARAFCPEVNIRKVKRAQIESGGVDQSEIEA